MTTCPNCHTVKVPSGYLCSKCATQARQSIQAMKSGPVWVGRLLWWQAVEIAEYLIQGLKWLGQVIKENALFVQLIGTSVILLTIAWIWLGLRGG